MHIDDDINYIYNYINYFYSSIYEFRDTKYLLDIAKRIKQSMINATFLDGNFDFYINNYVGQELCVKDSNTFKDFETIKNHIYLLMNYYKIYYGTNIENYSKLLYELTRMISNKYTSDEVITGIYDSEIESMIQLGVKSEFNPKFNSITIPLDLLYISTNNGEVIDERTSITQYIINYLEDNNQIFEFNGSLKYLSNLISNEICNKCINLDRLLLHEYDDLIDSFIRKKLFGIRYKEPFRKVCAEVGNYIMHNNTYIEICNSSEKIAEEIFRLSKYLIKLGFNDHDIVSGKCSDLIEKHLRIDCIKVNSIICKMNKDSKQNLNKFKLCLNSMFSSTRTKQLAYATVSSIMSMCQRSEVSEYCIIDDNKYEEEILDIA